VHRKGLLCKIRNSVLFVSRPGILRYRDATVLFLRRRLNMHNARYWIDRLGLERHPEGGYFRETYRSGEVVSRECLPGRYSGDRSFSTAIYFLLTGDDVSRLHRIRSDEIWHFYSGSSLIIHIINGEGACTTITLGNSIEGGECFQAVVQAGCWFGATVADRSSYSLVGCTVSPGFDFDDFELGKKEVLMKQYPQHGSLIDRLC